VPFLVEDELKRVGAFVREGSKLAAFRDSRWPSYNRTEPGVFDCCGEDSPELLECRERHVNTYRRHLKSYATEASDKCIQSKCRQARGWRYLLRGEGFRPEFLLAQYLLFALSTCIARRRTLLRREWLIQ